jgi:hypothetical protein
MVATPFPACRAAGELHAASTTACVRDGLCILQEPGEQLLGSVPAKLTAAAVAVWQFGQRQQATACE